MKNKYFFRLAIFLLALTTYSLSAQTTVNSLLELKPYMSQDNVNIKLAPGDYYLNADDISSGDWGEDIPFMDWAKGIIVFSGSNSTFDFTGVTIYFNTNLFTAFGSFDVWEIEVRGNNNTLKNLTMVDDGSVYDAPTKGAINLLLDGQYNVVDGFHITGKGSSPYAWGDSFGKGSGSIVSLQKHSAVIFRGDYNTLKNTTIMHRAFGHCLAMQAANTPTIDGCYIEGDMRSTDDMLSDPDILNPPITTWGYRLPSGYTKALCEEGIRSYNRGETLINGSYIERGTNDITVKNTTVKNTRGGCSIVLSGGYRHVENVTLIGNEFGFSVGDAELINCAADCTYGPAYMNAYDDKRNKITGDLTILPPSEPYHNGSGVAAFFGGSNSNINIHNTDGSIGNGLVIKVGGVTDNVGQIGDAPHTATGNIINNNTNYPIVIDSGSSNNTVISCATVTDNGTNNTVSNGTSCLPEVCFTYPDLEQAPAGLISGLKYYYFEGTWSELPNFNTTTPVSSGTSNGLDLSVADADDNYGFRYFGYLNIPEDGEYTFYTTSNDESKLLIDGALVVHNTGSGMSEISGNVCLEAGLHQFSLDFYEGVGNENLSVKYESSGISKQDVSEFYYVSSPENMALNGVATQSSTAYDGPPELAIDGNTNGSYSGGSVTHTEHGANGSGELKWWQVDLESDKVITKINIYNRTDNCCKSRFNDFTVKVIDANGLTTFSQFYEDHPNPLKVITLEDVAGQIVRIEKTSDYGLTIAEVQVFGLNASSLSVEEPNLNLQTINAYPNPVNDFLTVSLVDANFRDAKVNISLYSISGQEIIQTVSESKEMKLDLSNLQAGLYILKISDKTTTITKKVVKL
ncbi:T9SS type A sorting domain-containing protein [Seonamhaeicola sp. MEBiC1930]|uniref:T9SS type A sorting domain-containing protein n=1 Tax=Seonamhaeicola sp. MEBiC01930 TaxID=2976768 RepID=UPI0032509486